MNEKKTVLLSVIGKPPAGHYKLTKYRFGNEIEETDFFFLPLIKHYKPAQIFLIGTKDSIWDEVEKKKAIYNFEYEKVEIPFGVDDAEMRTILQTIVSLPLQDCKLIIDVTHGFRAIPFAVMLACFYFQTVKDNIEILDILYGNFEARDEKTNISPIVHLTSYLDITEWIGAANRFVNYGDGDLLYKKLSQEYSNNSQMEGFLTSFKNFSDNLLLTLTSQISKTGEKLRTCYSTLVKKELNTHPYYKIIDPLVKNRLRMFLSNDADWLKQLNIAEWYFDNRQYTQTLIMLRELMLTFMCDLLKIDNRRKVNREKKAGFLHTYLVNKDDVMQLKNYNLSDVQIARIQSKISEIEALIGSQLFLTWINLIKDIQEARNNAGHGFIKKVGKGDQINPEEQIKAITFWIKSVYEVIQQILNSEHLDEIHLIFTEILITSQET